MRQPIVFEVEVVSTGENRLPEAQRRLARLVLESMAQEGGDEVAASGGQAGEVGGPVRVLQAPPAA
jgi:hypothetical protein